MPPSTTISISDVGPVLLERSSRAKRINISVRPFRGIRVAVPYGISFTNAEQFARSKSEWLKKSIARMKKQEEICNAAISGKIMPDRNEAKRILVKRLEEIAEKHGYSYNRVTVRAQRTRWGSCSSRNDISLNMKLMHLPDELRDFILLHELVHTRVKNHGREFRDEILKAEPRAEELSQRLKEYCLPIFQGDG
ncbi:MAG: M48 family metallopeptidase [Desulfobulbaceae bacterium]|nr:M48 family metallopeptidase [Desulfobulbaceae bacterium]